MKAALADTGVSVPVLLEKFRLPFWLKLAFTAYMTVLLPVYLRNYGPTNFVYFCVPSILRFS